MRHPFVYDMSRSKPKKTIETIIASTVCRGVGLPNAHKKILMSWLSIDRSPEMFAGVGLGYFLWNPTGFKLLGKI